MEQTLHNLAPRPIRHLRPEKCLRIVAIGGGTGLSALLQGLKPYARSPGRSEPRCLSGRSSVVDITAVVTVTDDGGSSGRLRRDFEVLPPGDLRNCLVALSQDEALLARLLQYRFPRGRGLKGHSFGNLLLTALTQITRDSPQALKLVSDVLAIAGRIYPSTSANVGLEARLENGSTAFGETSISKSRSRIVSIALKPPHCSPLQETLEAIAQADLITLGPGSLFTSIIPNLLVKGIPQAIQHSPAVKACFVNLMWQPGETVNFTAADHIHAIYKHAGVKLLDYAVVNTRPISEPLRRKYARRNALPVENDLDRLFQMGLTIIGRDLLQESEQVRHDPAALACVALELAVEGRKRRESKCARLAAVAG